MKSKAGDILSCGSEYLQDERFRIGDTLSCGSNYLQDERFRLVLDPGSVKDFVEDFPDYRNSIGALVAEREDGTIELWVTHSSAPNRIAAIYERIL